MYGEINSTAPKKFKFRVDDHVRLSLRKRLFKKRYKMNWTEEIFQITHQLSGAPVVYTVQDLLERPMKKSCKRLNALTFLELRKYQRNV